MRRESQLSVSITDTPRTELFFEVPICVTLVPLTFSISRRGIIEKQEADREVVLFGDDGEFSHWVSKPDARTVIHDPTAVRELALPDRR